LKTLTNPEIFSLGQKDNGQSRKKQEWTEYTLTRSYGPSQRAREERERTKQKALHNRNGKNETEGVALYGIEDIMPDKADNEAINIVVRKDLSTND
jgi:hypothetical protein